MPAPTHIIVATDFSPASNAALPYAAPIARLFHAEVTLLHVFQYAPKHRYSVSVEWMSESIRKEAVYKLDEGKRDLQRLGVDARTVMVEGGDPVQQILGFAQTYQSPILVIGTHAVAGMERFLLGSTAEEVLRTARSPVISVGPHVGSATKDSLCLQKILFATDLSKASLASIPFLLELQKLSGARLRVVHIADHSAPEQQELQRFEPIRTALAHTDNVEYLTLHGKDVSHAIVDEAQEYSADLIVLGVRHAPERATHFAAKIAFQIIAAAPCAVLTVSS
jgi:nucleotide-binding universal stress UspA family protein